MPRDPTLDGMDNEPQFLLTIANPRAKSDTPMGAMEVVP